MLVSFLNISLICHISIVFLKLPIIIFELGKMANDRTLAVKSAMHSYGDSDCHILMVLSLLPLTIFEFESIANT